jgi:hypothetical protein
MKTSYAMLKGVDAAGLAAVSTRLAKIRFGMTSDTQVLGVDRNPARLAIEAAVRKERDAPVFDDARGVLASEKRYEYKQHYFTLDAAKGVVSTPGAKRDFQVLAGLLKQAGATGVEINGVHVDLQAWIRAFTKTYDTAQLGLLVIDNFYAEPKLIGRFSAKSMDNRLELKQIEELGGSLRSIRFAFFHNGIRRMAEARADGVLSVSSADQDDLEEFADEQEKLLLKHADVQKGAAGRQPE